MKQRIFSLVVVVFVGIVFLAGCTDYHQIPNGNVAKRKTEAGLEAKIYGPGSVDLWDFRDKKRLVALEFAQIEKEAKDEILCQDKMNLPFRVEARFGIPRDDDKAINTAFAELSPDKKLDKKVDQISNEKWFKTYAKAALLATAKGVLSHYKTMEVGMQLKVYPLNKEGKPDSAKEPVIVGVSRETLNAQLKSDLDKVLKNTPVKCFFAAFTNFDYPTVVTEAIESAKRVEIEIGQERAEQEKRLIKAANEEAIAQYNYRIEVLDALKVADSNRIIGDSVSLGFLWYLQTKVLGEAAKGPNNWGFVPYTAFESQAASGVLNAKVMDEMLGKRLTQGGADQVSDLAKKLKEQLPKVKIEEAPKSK